MVKRTTGGVKHETVAFERCPLSDRTGAGGYGLLGPPASHVTAALQGRQQFPPAHGLAQRDQGRRQ
jgi:hypothetical protein